MNTKLLEAYLDHQQALGHSAETGYLAWLKDHPKDSNAWQLLGILYAQTHDYDAGLQALKTALELNPNNASIAHNIGNIYRITNDFKAAHKHLLQAIQINPQSPSINNSMGTLHAKENNYEQAIEYYQQAIDLQNNYGEAWFNLGLIYVRTNQINLAIDSFNQALQHNPCAKTHQQLGQIHYHLEDYELAITNYKQAIKLQPNLTLAYHQLGCIYCNQQDFNLAIEFFLQALKHDPEHKESHHNLAAIYSQQHNYEQALPHWLRSITAPANISTLCSIGATYLALNQALEAKPYLLDALALDSDNIDANIALGAVYLKSGEISQAKFHYTRALELDSSLIEVSYVLDAIKLKQGAISTTKHKQAPNTYVKNLFNQYAQRFDEHLVGKLEYNTPTILTTELIDHMPKGGWKLALDLGCGTGLVAKAAEHLAHKFIGIDLAEAMLIEANKTKLYSQLICDDLINNLSNNNYQADLILAGDVIPYFGDCAQLLQNIAGNLVPKGILALTIELSSNDSWELQGCARYAHSLEQFRAWLLNANLKLISATKFHPRKQNNEPVNGMILIASRSHKT